MTIAAKQVALKVGSFQVENLGVDSASYFPGYGLGPSSKFAYCAYGIGDTEEEAFQDCLEMVAQQGFDIDGETEERIRAEYGAIDDSTTVAEYLDWDKETIEEVASSGEESYFHVGIKWNCRQEERFGRVKKLTGIEFLRYEDYCPQGPSRRYSGLQDWGYTRRIDPDCKTVSYGDLKPADCPESATAYLEALSDDSTEEGELYFYLPYASGSDYSGSTVEKANHRAFQESYGQEPFVWEATGGFDTYATVIGLTGLLECPDDTFDLILGVIEGLDRYPLIDDEALSNLESELADEAWESWVASDFRRALEKKFDGIDFDWPNDADLRSFFERKREEANEYWESESCGPSVFVRVEKVAEGIALADLDDWTVKYIVSWGDVGQETEEYTSETEAIERVESLRAAGFIGASYMEA